MVGMYTVKGLCPYSNVYAKYHHIILGIMVALLWLLFYIFALLMFLS